MDEVDYNQQLITINHLLETCSEGTEKDELLSLKANLEELISLMNDSDNVSEEQAFNNALNDSNPPNNIDDEYAKFMLEIHNEEGTSNIKNNESVINISENSSKQDFLKELEGKKFRAPHKHSWGEIVYHNAMVSSITDPGDARIDECQVRVLFLNPTHKEMLPCPYYFDLERDCNFSESQCNFSHGELIPYSSLREYVEPKYELLSIGSLVLAKQSNNLWYRATIKQILKENCLVKFDSKSLNNKNYEEIEFQYILPLENSENNDESDDESNSESEETSYEMDQSDTNKSDIINMTLMNTPSDQALGNWEKYTTGIGSKLMQKMGYIVGAGLGKKGVGIVNPITAIVLPPGKSLDYCMRLKEQYKNPNLFDADKKIRINQRKQEKRQRRLKQAQQHPHRKAKMDVCEFINCTLKSDEMNSNEPEHKNIQELKDKLKRSSEKELNLANFTVEENIKKEIMTIDKLRRVLSNFINKDDSQSAKLTKKLQEKQVELKKLQNRLHIIKTEINRRKNNKEMSVF